MKPSLLLLGLAVFGLGAGQVGAELATSGAVWSRLMLGGAVCLYLGSGLVLSSLRPARTARAARARLADLSERLYAWTHPTAPAVPILAVHKPGEVSGPTSEPEGATTCEVVDCERPPSPLSGICEPHESSVLEVGVKRDG